MSNQEFTKPAIVEDHHLQFLDDLRESGDTNMFGAQPYLMAEYTDLSKVEAREVLGYWMNTFTQRHSDRGVQL